MSTTHQTLQDLVRQVNYPKAPTERGPGENSVLIMDYRAYPTAKNIPASLKGKADQSTKSEDLLGYKGDVLKSDPKVREGKGL
jgi:hypothetical protein